MGKERRNDSLDNERPRKKPRKATRDWERKYLGRIELTGQPTYRDEREINVNDKVIFESTLYYQKPITSRGRRKQSKLQSCWQRTTLRFKTAKGAHLGIIDNEKISFMIANLVDAGVCEFEGQIL